MRHDRCRPDVCSTTHWNSVTVFESRPSDASWPTDEPRSQCCRESVCLSVTALSPFLTGRMFVRPNILRTLRRTMIRFLIELLVRRIWFGQSKFYFILNWLVMRCKLQPEHAADSMIVNVG